MDVLEIGVPKEIEALRTHLAIVDNWAEKQAHREADLNAQAAAQAKIATEQNERQAQLNAAADALQEKDRVVTEREAGEKSVRHDLGLERAITAGLRKDISDLRKEIEKQEGKIKLARDAKGVATAAVTSHEKEIEELKRQIKALLADRAVQEPTPAQAMA